ncbi:MULTISPECIES: NTP transferase domain-containing protein [unclassified Halomonas]|uniref:nucleotidyltransferase family protein n=1 Tax=unclassified Halomonas TaxID=2609666 RepID=UPI001CF51AE5|nr:MULTISPECIES: nucleotidyltransferase family protein [unclassified Halomonas]MCA8866341.1 nucleotidyltransferase family protein [Halomonas sp. SBBP1]UZH09909.1 nucleotidyltransferase family protein [Halomonas sp. BDJS001]
MSASHVVALVMAAGYSRRFGEDDKRCAPLADGRSLLTACVANAEQAFPLLRVAIREEDEATLLGLADNTPLIRLHQAHLGLGASLAEAVSALSHDARLNSVEAVAILLADMPWIQQGTLGALQRLATRDTIVRPSFKGQPGHPVIFGRVLWPALQVLSGDDGAKGVIQRHTAQYREYAVQDEGILSDIDAPEDNSVRR